MIGSESVYIDSVSQSLTPEAKSIYFHDAEMEYCDVQENPAKHYAMRYCGKRAIFKALGLLDDDPDFLDVKILRTDGGRPSVNISGPTSITMRRMGFQKCSLSMDSLDNVANATTAFER